MPFANPSPRGVYLGPGTGPSGERTFVAVDRHGIRRFVFTLTPTDDTSVVEVALWRLLDELDPPCPDCTCASRGHLTLLKN